MKKNYISFLKRMSIGLIALLTSMGGVYASPKAPSESRSETEAQQNKITVKGVVEDVEGPIIGETLLKRELRME